MTDAARFDKGTMIAWRFELEGLIGDGGMGVVYRAKETDTGRACALKFIRPELLEDQAAVDKFLIEAELCKRIGSHPNIVEVIDSGFDEENEVPYLAMELVEGDDLADWVQNHAPVSNEHVAALFTQLGAALDEAHAAGVVHRDLKSPNLLVAKGSGGAPILKVLDFGIAKVFGDSQKTATLVGTPQYCAPEQLGAGVRRMAEAKGFRVATGVSPATDVFALGLIAYEVLTNSDISEFWGTNAISDLIAKTCLEPRANPSERAGLNAMRLPEGFDAWFKRCTAHDAAERFPGAGDAVRALEALLRGERLSFDRQMLETSPTGLHDPLLPDSVLPGGGAVAAARVDTVFAVPAGAPVAKTASGTEVVQPIATRTEGSPGLAAHAGVAPTQLAETRPPAVQMAPTQLPATPVPPTQTQPAHSHGGVPAITQPGATDERWMGQIGATVGPTYAAPGFSQPGPPGGAPPVPPQFGAPPAPGGFGALSGPPYAPPPGFAQPAPKKSNGGVFLLLGGLVALLLLLGTGGFFAYRAMVAQIDKSSSSGSDEDDGRRAPRRRRTAPPKPVAPPVAHDTAAIAVHADDPRWGDADAPATIVVFSDMQCPFCARVLPTLEGLKAKYGEKQLRVVWKDFPLPFHTNAEPAQVAARAVYELGGDEAFWKFHDLAFANSSALTNANFEVWASATGVSLSKYQRVVVDPKIAARVKANVAEGASYGVKGTPSFYINGIFISGARPPSAFEAEIDGQITEAARLVASGTPKERVYVDLTNKNFKGVAPTPPPPSTDSITVWKVPVAADDPVKGNRDALVTIVVFSEFQCPYCQKVGPTLAQLLVDYGAKLRVVWKDNPLSFHKRAFPAAMVAREVYAQQGDAGFWSIHDVLFANQAKLEDADLWGYAFSVGANVDKVKNAVLTKKHQAIVDRSQTLAADFKATGTPHFFINGRRLAGAQDASAFKTIIDEEVVRANMLLLKGVAPSKLYEELIKGGGGAEPLERKAVGPAPLDAPFKGDKSAPVVIQEFSDFQCPFCARVSPTMAALLASYGNKVKVVWRHKVLPMHADAQLAHEAAVEAYVQQGNVGFWKMHDLLFANQKALSRTDLERYASDIGLDMVKFRAALDTRRHRARVDADGAASTAAGISGTPGFAINGYFISGAQPEAKFRKIIDQALTEVP